MLARRERGTSATVKPPYVTIYPGCALGTAAVKISWEPVRVPTGCATRCMTFRHRHGRLGRLIETAEGEPGKAEAGENKAVCEGDAGASRRKGCPHSSLLQVPLYLSSASRQQCSRTCSKESKRLRKLAGEGGNQAPSPQRGGCRTFLDKRAGERRGAANASCWMYCR